MPDSKVINTIKREIPVPVKAFCLRTNSLMLAKAFLTLGILLKKKTSKTPSHATRKYQIQQGAEIK